MVDPWTAGKNISFKRFPSIDILRGLIIVIMALDHVRDFFTDVNFSPTDIDQTTPELFFTRWITHICAPVFVFLAGTSVYLGISQGKSKKEISKFLVTRGLILVFLDLTIITFGWNFDLSYLTFLNVVWAIGVSMIVLAGLIHLPMPAIIGFGAIMVLGHNLLDGFSTETLPGGLAVFWQILYEQVFVDLEWIRFVVIYPLVPWFGVMALGYALGALYKKDTPARQRKLMNWGLIITGLFFVIRGLNFYGDPNPWAEQETITQTILSFFNTTKYPASLDFLLMTLGPALILLSLFERLSALFVVMTLGPTFISLSLFEKLSALFGKVMIVFGRVPLFFYIIHIYFIHLLAAGVGVVMGFPASEMMKGFPQYPENWGFNLLVVYLFWIGVVAALYPLCQWFSKYKQTSKKPWLALF